MIKKTTMTIVMAVLCVNFYAGAQVKEELLKALEVGDKLPESFWTREHQLYNHGKIKKVNFSEYRNKLLVIDFWGTWCAPCFGNFETHHQLETDFASSFKLIKVSQENLSQLHAFANSSRNKLGTALESVILDRYFSNLFPHQLIPHMVWIRNGAVLAITNAAALNATKLHQVLDSNTAVFKYKRDLMTKNGQPLMLEKQPDGMLSYSLLIKGAVEGISVGYNYHYENEKLRGVLIQNQSMYEIYRFAAFKNFEWIDEQRILLELKNPDAFTAFNHNVKTPGFKQHLYTLDFWTPLAEADHLYKNLLGYLDMHSPYTATVAVKNRDCLVLRLKGKPQFIDAQPYTDTLFTLNGGLFKMNGGIRNLPLKIMVMRLKEQKWVKMPVLDETGFEGVANLDIGPVNNLEMLNAALDKYGLEFKIARRRIKMLIIKDK